MTVYTGLISTLTVNGNDISEDVLSISISSPSGMIDISALDLVGFQRLVGRRDTSLQVSVRVSSAAAGGHATLSPATSTTVSGAVVITTTAGPVFTFTGTVANYDVSIGNDLALQGSSTILMNDGVAGVWS